MRRHGAMASWVWAILLIMPLAPVNAQNASAWKLDVETPEVLGYTIGDLIHHRAHLVLDAPYRLDENALPEVRKLSSWLELRSVDLDSHRGFGSSTYDIGITYQIFNTTETVSVLATPPVSLTIVDGDNTFPVIIPAWSFSVSPVAAVEEILPGILPTLRPSRVPPPMDLHRYALRITLLSTALLGAVAYFVYLNGSIPLLRRSHGPFARAHRRLKMLRRQPSGDPVRREAYRCLHAAFNETAGRVVFCDDLDSFFAEQPRFGELRASIESFYFESRQLFFSAQAPNAATAANVDTLLRLALRFRDAERGLA